MQLVPPIIPQLWDWKTSVSQFFGVNKKTYQPVFGIPGHNGIDIVVRGDKRGYGTPIVAAHDGIVEKIIQDVPHTTRGNGIYIMSLDGKFSTNYWHLSQFNVHVGQKVKAEETIGLMGNSGFVKPPPTQVCPHCGTHLHFGLKIHGLVNEYKGFVDPTPHLFKEGEKLPFKFLYDMFVGKQGDDVSHLQTILKIEGFAEDYEPIGYFGMKTLRDVRKLQQKYGITPSYGYAGYKTRLFLKGKYT